MARQEVDIGVVGNDGTGDSIREAFRKVNENFREIYAVFNLGDVINLQNLGNVPDELSPNRVLTTDSTGNYIKDRLLEGGDGIEIDAASDPDKIVISSLGTSVSSDSRPSLSGHLNANGNLIANISDPIPELIQDFNDDYASLGIQITANDVVISKGYADRYYIRKSGGSASSSGQLRVRNEPINANEYTLVIDSFVNYNANIPDHGFDNSIDGAAYVYNTTGQNANNLVSTINVLNTNFVIGNSYRIETLGNTDYTLLGAQRNKVGEIFTLKDKSSLSNSSTGNIKKVYFIKYFDKDYISFYNNFADAQAGTNRINVSSGSGIQTLQDAYYNSTLDGNWVSNEVLPRQSVVRREGDTMTGLLTLADHPFPLQGSGTPNRPDDLQAATKYYVDNSSFTSQIDLYVSSNGKDLQLDTPPGKEGRAWAYAYKTIGKACEKAEYLMNNSAYETGPYRQLIAINNGTRFSVVTNYTAPGTDGIARIKFSNNGGSNVDQGTENNVDLIPGKLIKGRISGATGFIYRYYGSDNLSTIGEDYFDLQYVQGEFLLGENLEFGDGIKNLHITIFVESGIYEEDYPIKIPANTAVVGDEFRRVLVRPKDRISQSPWVDTWFFRNSQFDNLTIVNSGTQYDTSTAGYYGYHYLKKSNLSINRGTVYTNIGGYDTEADILLTNKTSIANDVVTYINTLGAALTNIEESKCIRDVKYIIEAIASDLEQGGMEKILEIQETFSQVTLSANCKQGLSYIDDIINNGVFASQSNTIKTLVTNMIDKIMFGYDTTYNTPKNNKDMDVFLCNDSAIVRQITCQGHGGFMMVLDPYGQILSKSPYCQQSGSFSGSLNKKAFRGGQYIDGFSGNLTPIITSKLSPTKINISGIPRAPLTPTSFFIDGTRYKVDSWVPTGTGKPNCEYLLKSNKYFIQSQTISYIAEEYNEIKYPYFDLVSLMDKIIDAITFDVTNGGNSQTIDVTKKFFNRRTNLLKFNDNLRPLLDSMLNYMTDIMKDIVSNISVTINQNDYTQVINLNRGGENGGLGQIENLMENLIDCVTNGLTQLDGLSYPSFSLILDSATPFNVTPLPTTITLITPGNTSMLSNDFTQVNDLGYGIITNNNGLAECVSVFSYYCWTSMFSNNGGQIRSLNSSSANGEYGLVAAGSDPLEIPDSVTLVDNSIQVATVQADAAEKALFIYVNNFQYLPYNVSIVEIDHGPTVGIIRYEMNNITVTDRDLNDNPTVIKLNFNTAGNNDTSTTGLKGALLTGSKVIIRSGQNFKFTNVLDTNPVRPSTALTFEGDPLNDITAPVYRVISYNVVDPDSEPLATNESILTFDTTYNYVSLIVDQNYVAEPDPDDATKTLGSQPDDLKIAIKVISDVKAVTRLNTAQMITAWDGKIHRITEYVNVNNNDYAYVSLVDTDLNGDPLPNLSGSGNGLVSSVDTSVNLNLKADSDVVLRAGLSAGEPANITVRISTMRATGHDFLDIGTGGYNSSNYPSKIYGAPKEPNQAREVEERTRGRVFYVSTDQDGFFRVGRFFTVDQGTGTVTFAASIALSNLDGIGFKRGISVAEFSSDDKFIDLAQDTVPTEAAISRYIDRRLGMDRQGNALDPDEVFAAAPGFIDRLGINNPLNDLDFSGSPNNFTIINLRDPVGPADAATKNYVDIEVDKFNTLEKLNDVVITSSENGEVLAFVGSLNASVNAQISGDLTTVLEFPIKSTLTNSISAIGVVNQISITDTSSFPASGYVLIDNEVFKYSSKDFNSLNGVVRLSDSANNDDKFNSSFPSAHSVGADVAYIGTSVLNYQIKPQTIINADVNNNAGIAQSKLALVRAGTCSEDPSAQYGYGKPSPQDYFGLSRFSFDNFEVNDGDVRIKPKGILRTDIEDVGPGLILGNLGASANSIQQVTPEDILKRATWNSLSATSQNSKDHVYTFFKGADEADSQFKTTEININVTNNSVVKRTSTGNIKVTNIDTNGNVTFISASGSDNSAMPVTYYGQWSPGSNATFTATYANSAGSANTANSATTAGSANTANSATTAGTITNQANSATITAASANTAGTIVLRDNNGDFSCGVMTGTATQARYADLAEKYTSDKIYEPGTVLIFGGSAETTTTNIFGDSRVAGVVSTDPAHLMNSELKGTTAIIALQGRVPCKVVGKVKKGDLLTTSASPGHAAKAYDPKVGTIIGKALEDKDTAESGIIEVAVGRV